MGLGPRWDGVRDAVRRATLDEAQRSLAETAEDPRFPGGLIPALSPEGRLTVYGVAEDAAEWRRLRPLLLAFAGPTVTSFDGTPAILDVADTVEAALSAAGPYAVARMRPGTWRDGDATAVRALLRLRALLGKAPDLAIDRPLPTSRLLASFQDALNIGDVDAARRVLNLLGTELRLDAANLLHLEVAVLGVSRDWAGIREHPRFDTLCASRPPAAVAEILLEAAYRTNAGKDAPVITDAALSQLRPYADLLLPLVPGSTTEAVLRVRGLFAAPTQDAVDNSGYAAAEESIAGAAKALLDLAEACDDPRMRQAAADAVGKLAPAEREALLAVPWFSERWLELGGGGTTGSEQVRGWTDWLERLPDADFNAMPLARQAATVWRPPNEAVDPAEGRTLAEAINAVPNGLAEERLDEAMAYWVAWAESDPHWPRAAFRPVYYALLERMAISAQRGEAILRSGAAMLEGLLQIGLDSSNYSDTVEAVDMIIGSGLNRNSVYDVLNYLDALAGHRAADPRALAGLRERTRDALTGLFHRLSAAQRAAVRSAFPDETLWDTGTSLGEANFDTSLKSLRIAIYTLNESAGRQARDALIGMEAGVTVNLHHDTVGSQPLAASARGADIFVVVWRMAKHAATGFIEQHRGKLPITYATGGGASSIIQAVEREALKLGMPQ